MTINDYIQIFECDAARIYYGQDKMFLIIGWERSTKKDREEGRDSSVFLKNGEPYDFDYLQEQVIASGGNDSELEASAREYKRLLGVSFLDFLRDVGINPNCPT